MSGEVGKTSPSTSSNIVLTLFSHSVSLGLSGRLKLLLILSKLLTTILKESWYIAKFWQVFRKAVPCGSLFI